MDSVKGKEKETMIPSNMFVKGIYSHSCPIGLSASGWQKKRPVESACISKEVWSHWFLIQLNNWHKPAIQSEHWVYNINLVKQ